MKLFKRNPSTDRDKEYWDVASKKSLDQVMDNICDGFDEKKFSNNKESIIFEAKINFKLDDTVLDLACGIGRTAKWVAPLVKEYYGVDYIQGMVSKATEYNIDVPNTKFKVTDGKTLDFPNDMFDIVYCELAYQHMRKEVQSSYTSEVHRVLKPGGRFYVQIPKFEFYKDTTYSHYDIKGLFDIFSSHRLLEVEDKRYIAYFAVEATK